jgi:hypothetical protein
MSKRRNGSPAARTESRACLPRRRAASAIHRSPKFQLEIAASPCRRQLKISPTYGPITKKLDPCRDEGASERTFDARHTDDESKAKVVDGLPRYLTGFGETAFRAGAFYSAPIHRISRNSPVVWEWRRQEPVSTSAENALWCRDFAVGRVILLIDIKGLARCQGLWRLV